MRILVLGGTVFLGRALATQAVAAGDEVTCAARGTSGAVPEGAELVRVDRAAPDGLAALAGREFDAVLDVARRPSQVRSALAALGHRAGHWTFVSSASVYPIGSRGAAPAQSAEVLDPPPEGIDDPVADGMEYYGPLKVVCEQAVAQHPVPALVCRAGLIVGPEDPSDRFTWWPVRLARGGAVLAPGAPADPVQFVDVRDLAAWLLSAARRGVTGVFNGVGTPMPRADFLSAVASGVAGDAPDAPDGPPELVWVGQEALLAAEVAPWAGENSLPLWLPLPEYDGFMELDVRSAYEAGLTTRPVADTARDTLAWYRASGSPPLRCGLAPDVEAALLAQAGAVSAG